MNLKKNVSPFRWKLKSYKRYVTLDRSPLVKQKAKGDHEEAGRILAEVGNLGAELNWSWENGIGWASIWARNDHNVDSNLPDAEVPDGKDEDDNVEVFSLS